MTQMKMQEISVEHFSNVSEGVARIRSTLVYNSNESANCWIDLTKSSEYQYYEQELDQIRKLIFAGALSDLNVCRVGVHFGAADALKEIAIVNSISQNNQRFTSLFLDSSMQLLDLAVKNFSNRTVLKARGALVDFTDLVVVRGHVNRLNAIGDCPKLFTSFGNTVGNYDGLFVIQNICSLMDEEDYLIFGVHKKIGSNGDNSYLSYKSNKYLNHMGSILRYANIDPQIGRFKIRLEESSNQQIDTVVITFEISEEYFAYVSHWDKGVESKLQVKEIILDTSSKYSLPFLKDEISRIGLDVERVCPSVTSENIIFLCKKKPL